MTPEETRQYQRERNERLKKIPRIQIVAGQAATDCAYMLRWANDPNAGLTRGMAERHQQMADWILWRLREDVAQVGSGSESAGEASGLNGAGAKRSDHTLKFAPPDAPREVREDGPFSQTYSDARGSVLRDLWLWASEQRTHLATDPVPDGLGQRVLAVLNNEAVFGSHGTQVLSEASAPATSEAPKENSHFTPPPPPRDETEETP